MVKGPEVNSSPFAPLDFHLAPGATAILASVADMDRIFSRVVYLYHRDGLGSKAILFSCRIQQQANQLAAHNQHMSQAQPHTCLDDTLEAHDPCRASVALP